MKKKTRDSDTPIGKLSKVKDFLPPPGELVFPDKPVKVTISLSKASVKFFKMQAKKNQTKYQKMIRALLDSYVRHYISK